MPSSRQIVELAQRIDPARAEQLRRALGGRLGRRELAYAVLVATAFPAQAPAIERAPERMPSPAPLARWQRDRLAVELGDLQGDALRVRLRRLATRERLRVALRELLGRGRGGGDVTETARELSDLADLTVEAALAEARRQVFGRLGTPLSRDGSPGGLVVLGMGKLGGQELNVGSDIDLVCFYDSDDGEVVDGEGRPAPSSVHQVWAKVVQRMTATLADVTDDGFVWRVDLRLRPEGARGPLCNSLAAAERYYESFGRLWERAAMLRARPVAGDMALGSRLLAMLQPFVWRRQVDPRIADTMYDLVHRARDELSPAPERDLKLGPGGIREAEFFVQALQLVWGGREPWLRVRPTLAAVSRLLAAGYVSEREAEELQSAYVMLRRAEHAVQLASGVQTHSLPRDPAELERIARALGLGGSGELAAELSRHTDRVGALLGSLLSTGEPRPSRWGGALMALDRAELEVLAAELEGAGLGQLDAEAPDRIARDLFDLAARAPDGPLGARTREQSRDVSASLLDAIADCADPAQATGYLRALMARVRHPAVYTRMLADDVAAVRRLTTVLGGSAFVGDAVAARPELCDLVLFEHREPTPADAHEEVARALAQLCGSYHDEEERTDRQVGSLRRAKVRVTTQVALADLAEHIDTAGATRVLSALADASLQAATRLAVGTASHAEVRGLCLLAMGKLGGEAIGYGSDLDVIFLFDPEHGGNDPVARFSRIAKRIITLVSLPHFEGRGYELDTRLRPSGSQGLLVSSIGAFARYHEVGEGGGAERAATWERLALLRARFVAGEPELGRRAMAIAHQAAYERPADLAQLSRDVARLRRRMEHELAKERPGRYDLKFGHGGLCDVELGTQLLQLAHSADHRVRTTGTAAAIDALEQIGALERADAATLRDGYAFLRRLEQRMHIVHGQSAHLLEQSAGGLGTLARRMGVFGDDPGRQLVERYRAVTAAIRQVYERLVPEHADH